MLKEASFGVQTWDCRVFFAAIDEEWPALQAIFKQWLDPQNFDEQGKQKVSLSSLTQKIVKNWG